MPDQLVRPSEEVAQVAAAFVAVVVLAPGEVAVELAEGGRRQQRGAEDFACGDATPVAIRPRSIIMMAA